MKRNEAGQQAARAEPRASTRSSARCKCGKNLVAIAEELNAMAVATSRGGKWTPT